MAREKRVAVQVGLGILSHIEPNKISLDVWNKQQLQRSVQLEIGLTSAEPKQVSHHQQNIPENG